MPQVASKTVLQNTRSLAQPAAVAGGPGTQLASILAGLGFTNASGCKCKEHAAIMDRWGVTECLRRINEITNWLQQEAHARGLPFSALLARRLVKQAITRARRQASKRA